jgi:hypothetical protein
MNTWVLKRSGRLDECLRGLGTGELLDIADTNGQLCSLVKDEAAKDLAPLDGVGYAIELPIFQQVVRDIAEGAQWTAH